MRLIILLAASALLALPLTADEFKFDDVEVEATELEPFQGRFRIVEVDKGNHALRIYALDKTDVGGVRIPLQEGKPLERNFKVLVDCRISRPHAAGKLLAIGDWDANTTLLAVHTVSTKRTLRVSSFADGEPVEKELCAYKEGQWLRFQISVNQRSGTYDITVSTKERQIASLRKLELNPEAKHAVFLDSATWPGQGKYAYDLDNIRIR